MILMDWVLVRVYSSDPNYCSNWPKKVINGEPYNCNFDPEEAHNYAGDREERIKQITQFKMEA